MVLTEPADWVGQQAEGYVVNAAFSAENRRAICKLINDIGATYQGAVFVMPKESLHITLLDWIAPLVSYQGKNKAQLFAGVQSQYDKILTSITANTKPIAVHFNEIRVSPSTIFIVGSDKGEFQAIRQQFVNKVELLPGTKPPPDIIHCSLARFTKPIDLNQVEEYISRQSIDISQIIDGFRLVHSTREPQLEFRELKYYKLG